MNKFIEHAKSMIDALDGQVLEREYVTHLSVTEFVRSYKTLTLGLPRQVGKTRFIAGNARNGDLIFTNNLMMVDYYKKQHWVKAESVGSWQPNRGWGTKDRWIPKTIWFDEVQPDRKVDEILYELIRSYDQRVIFMGTY